MGRTMHMISVENWVSWGARTIIAGNTIRGLVTGVLLVAATGMYFGMSAGADESKATSKDRTASHPVDWEPDIDANRSSLTNYVDEEGNPASSANATTFPSEQWSDLWVADLETEIEENSSYPRIFHFEDWKDRLVAGLETEIE